ncbi:MAG: ABC transporter permease [Clostridia bacterium]|nr:ABC transporter permease [Clostridia bacterium]
MRSAALKNTLRTIWRTKARYISILLIVALGVGFFAGIKASKPDMIHSTDKYSDSQNLMHFRVLSTWGFDEDDIKALSELKGVSVKRSYFLDAIVSNGSDESEAHFIAYDKDSDINELWLKDGRFPVKSSECILDSAASGFAIGSRLTVIRHGEGGELLNNDFTVVGHAYSSMYVSDFEHGNTTIGDGDVDLIAYIPIENFLINYNTEVYLVFDDMYDETVYSDGYLDAEARRKIEITSIGEKLTRERYDRTVLDANEKISDGRREIEDGEKELEDARKQLDDAQVLISDGEKQLEDALKLIAEKRTELEDGKKALEEGEAEYNQKSLDAANAGTALIEARRLYAEGYEEYTNAALKAEKELSAAREQISVAEVNLANGKEKLDEARETYESVRKIYDDALKVYEALRESYDNIKEAIGMDTEKGLIKEQFDKAYEFFLSVGARLDESKAELDANQAEYDRYSAELDEAKQKYNDGVKTADEELSAAQKKLSDAKAEIEYNEDMMMNGTKMLEDARHELDEAKQTISEGEEQLKAAEAEIEEKSAELEEAKSKFASGTEEYNDGLIKLNDAKAQLEDSVKQLEELAEPEWYVYTRYDNGGYEEFGQNAERIGNIAKVFPAFFIIVAALVSITGMSRLVSEERTQIGTMKALGYSGLKIFSKYLFYCLSATFLGCALGLSVGYKLFPAVILKAYSILYRIQVRDIPFLWSDAIIITAVSLAVAALTVLFSCLKAVTPVPAQLMRPAAPASGKRVLMERIRFIWRRLSFFSKVTVRNAFRYKKRMIMTLIGIMGCTALMLCGFALRDSISDIVKKQFDDVMHFSAMAYSDGIDESGISEIKDIIRSYDGSGTVTAATQKSYAVSSKSGKTQNVYVVAPESSDKADRIIDTKSRTTGERFTIEPGKTLLTEKLARNLGVKAGDMITISVSETKKADFTVSGVLENYIYHYLFISPESYEEMTGEAPEYNMLYIRYGDMDNSAEEHMAAEVVNTDHILTIILQSAIRTQFSKMMEALDAVVLVLILSAVLLAVVVLYNLASINIAERTREIATLEVLGFNDNEVSMYIFRESIILSIIGALLGLGLGRILAVFVINTAEIDMVMFGRQIHIWSYLLAAGLTIVFSLIVNLIMNRLLKKISMVEALKSVD